MPAPLALSPIAWTALRIGATAAVAFYVARPQKSRPKDPHRDHVLNGLPEGLSAESHTAEAEKALNGHGRFRRTVRFGRNGPGIEVDATALGRLRFRRVD